MTIKIWRKIGKPNIIAKDNFGRAFLRQKFENPRTKKIKECALFDTPSSSIPVIIFPLTIDKEILVIKQFRYSANKVLTELPGGNADLEESLQETAKRELCEETGYIAKKIIPLNSLPIWFEPSGLTSKFNAYLALDCEKLSEPQKIDNSNETEYVELGKIPLEEWLMMIKNGNILDNKSISTTFLAMLHLGIKIP